MGSNSSDGENSGTSDCYLSLYRYKLTQCVDFKAAKSDELHVDIFSDSSPTLLWLVSLHHHYTCSKTNLQFNMNPYTYCICWTQQQVLIDHHRHCVYINANILNIFDIHEICCSNSPLLSINIQFVLCLSNKQFHLLDKNPNLCCLRSVLLNILPRQFRTHLYYSLCL